MRGKARQLGVMPGRRRHGGGIMRAGALFMAKIALIMALAASAAPRPAYAENAAVSVMTFMICIDWRFNPLWALILSERDQERKEENYVGITSIYSYMRGGHCYSGPKKQRQWLEHLSEYYGWAEATYALAITYGYGDFDFPVFDFSDYQGWRTLKIRSNLGDGEGLDPAAAFALLTKAAEEGMPGAQLHLAHAYQTGEFGKNGAYPLPQDQQKSLMWLEELISDEENLKKWEFEGGDTLDDVARFQLGYRYRYGEEFGIAPDPERAFALFAEAARDKDYPFPDALTELALMCADDIIVSEICATDLYGQIQTKLELMTEDYSGGFRDMYQSKLIYIKEKGIQG